MINRVKHCINIISHSIPCIVFDLIYIYDMYSYLFIYIYVLQVYTLTWVLSLIYLTCYGSCIVVIHICMPTRIVQWCWTCVGYLQKYMWYFWTDFYCMSMWFTPWMLHVIVFSYWIYIVLHIYIHIIKFSSCIFIVSWCVFTYMFVDVSVIISDILGIYCSFQTVIL